MRNKLQQMGARLAQSRAAKGAAAVGSMVAATSAHAAFTVLPASAQTFYDGVIGLGADVGLMLFGIGGPILLAVVGWNVTRGGVKKGSRL